jgi:hypothetical protein
LLGITHDIRSHYASPTYDRMSLLVIADAGLIGRCRSYALLAQGEAVVAPTTLTGEEGRRRGPRHSAGSPLLSAAEEATRDGERLSPLPGLHIRTWARGCWRGFSTRQGPWVKEYLRSSGFRLRAWRKGPVVRRRATPCTTSPLANQGLGEPPPYEAHLAGAACMRPSDLRSATRGRSSHGRVRLAHSRR